MCTQTTVYTDRDIPDFIKRQGDNISVLVIARGFIPNTATLNHYVCASCGYTETYILNADERQEIAQRWTQVQPRTI